MHIAVRRYATWHPRPPVPIVSNRQARRRHRVLGLGSLGPQPVLRAIHDPAPPEITGESRRRHASARHRGLSMRTALVVGGTIAYIAVYLLLALMLFAVASGADLT